MDIKDVQELISEKKDNVLIPMVQSMSKNFAKCTLKQQAMANHGYCTRCFWQHFDGYCYMLMKFTKPYSYCPDYKSRKRTNESLEKWIKDNNVKRV